MEKRDVSEDAATPDHELGRVQMRGEGVGSATDGQVAERALEIAEIEGRPGRPTADDYARARDERRGVPDEAVDAIGDRPDSQDARDYSEDHGNSTKEGTDIQIRDESEDLNRLVHEGVDEANHEQMLEARREKETDEQSIDEAEGDIK